jgi:hypothetical protein
MNSLKLFNGIVDSNARFLCLPAKDALARMKLYTFRDTPATRDPRYILGTIGEEPAGAGYLFRQDCHILDDSFP